VSLLERPLEELLTRLRERDVRLWVEGEALRFSAPKGAVTPELRAELAARKPEVIAFLDGARRAASAEAGPRPVPRDERGLPLSFAQSRLWFLEQLGTLGAAYAMPLGLRLQGPLDTAALAEALDAIVERHEALRTAFRAVDGAPRQFVRPARPGLLARSDLTALPPARRETELERLAAAEAEQPFELAEGPLLRARLVALGPEEHVLLLVFHHIACDGWSIGLFARELSALYAACAEGRPAPLPPLPLQYPDYAAWQQGLALDGQLAWWCERLRDLPPLALPTDRPRRSVQAFRGAGRGTTLEAPLVEALTALGRRQGASLFMVTLAAFQLLVARLAGQERVGVGIPVANRNRAETEGLIGFFVNALVIDAELSDDPDFETLLGRVRDRSLAAFDRQDVPFERLVQALRPERSLDRNPLFQVAFALQQAEAMAPRFELPGLAVAPYGRAEISTRVDLELHLWPSGEGGLSAYCTYDRDLFEAESIDRLLRHYRRLLQAIVAAPQCPASRLPLLEETERAALLGPLAEGGPAPPPAGLAAAFLEQAARTPDRPALEDGDGRATSYAALAAEVEALAGRLVAAGVGPETPVALALEPGPAAVRAILAVLRAGGAFVPLDLRHPPERLRALLEDCGAPLVLADSPSSRATEGSVAIQGQEGHGPGLLRFARNDGGEAGTEALAFLPPGARLLRLDDEGPTAPLPPLPGPEALGYLIYTSGSTGQPKGVAVEQGGAVQLARAQIADFAVGPESRVLQFASLAFDAAVSEIFTALLSGACLCLAPRRALLPGPDLLASLRARRISVVTLPPSALAVMAPEGLPALATLASAGEACPAEVARRWAPGRRFLNAYGPTEVTVCAAEAVIDPEAEGAPPIGRPLPGKRTYVLDRHGEAAAPGQPGELYVGGCGLARGYLGRPAETAERFVPDPFSGTPGARLFRSGDRVRRRSDGALEYLGRIDRQVKLRGHRVEPEEIEAVLRRHPAVAEAAVSLRAEGAGEPRLVAHYAARPAEKALELWPSVAEFFVYDELLYYALAADERRNRAYRAAYARAVRDKVVLDVGTGGEAIQARLCLEAGARHVYAVELLQASYEQARATIERLGLGERITLIRGDARTLTLPEPVDLVVSEIVGSLGGAEGCVPILEAVRPLLKPGGCMIPGRSLTRIAALELPRAFLEAPAFAETGAHYAERIFAEAGRRFDLRLCLRNLGPEALLSAPAVFEHLDFAAPVAAESEHEIRLTVARPGLLAGLLAWLTLELDAESRLDTLAEEHTWLPVWFPLFWPGIDVRPGAVIEARIARRLSANGLNPDYRLQGRLIQPDGRSLAFDHLSAHQPEGVGGTALHRRLFGGETLPLRRAEEAGPAALRRHAAALLPEVMVPSAFVSLTALPVNASGKLDRAALAAFERPAAELPPALADLQRREIEARLAADPRVAEAALLPGPEGWLAYVAGTPAEAEAQAQVEAWRGLYDALHGRPEAAGEFHGWSSAVTGEAIPEDEMSAWAEETAARILALQPKRLLEIGCGTGILLRRLAPHCAYHGTDLSAAAVARAEAGLDPAWDARLAVGAADELDHLPAGGFDTIVLNSVVQYFPNEAYLLRVLEGALRLLAPGGRLFLGDLRHLGLAPAFQTAIARAAAPGAGDTLLRGTVLRRLEEEEELLLDPAWLAALPTRLPGVAAVRTALKRGPAHNELAAWRYDAVIETLPAEEPETPQAAWQDVAALEALLRETRPARLLLTGIPNARVADAWHAWIWLQGEAAPDALEAADPEALFALAARCGYAAAAAPGAAPERFDLLLAAGEERPLYPAFGPVLRDGRLRRPATKDRAKGTVNDPLAAQGRRQLAGLLQTGLAEHLPEAVLPAGLCVLEALPRRADGRLDERRLPLPEARRAPSAAAPPRNPTEARLAALWAEVLDLPAVGIDESFFELGGHSLLGTRLVARVTAELGVEAPVRLLFEAPSVAAFAARLEGAAPAGEAETEAPRRGSETEGLPLSPAQERLWFLGRLVPDDPFYNMPLLLRLEGPLDPAALDAALTALAARHEALRTRIESGPAGPSQRILPPEPLRAEVTDLSGLPPERREAEARRLAGEAARRPFALEGGPLLRVALLRLSAGDHILVLVLHHILSDGWSNGMLLRDLAEAYRRARDGGDPTLPPLPLRQADAAQWQRDRLDSPALQVQLDYWRGQLAGLEPLQLPSDRPRPALQDFRGASLPLALPAELTQALEDFARREGATLFMVLLAAFQALLGRCAGQEEVAVGTPVAGRERPELEGLVGLFVNTLVLRGDLAGDPTPRQLLGRVRETALGAFANQALPFDRLVQALNPPRDPSRNPLFQAMFALQNAPAPPAELAGLTLEPLPHDNHATRFDLELSLWPAAEGAGLQGALTYAESLFERPSMAALLRRWRLLLEGFVAAPDRPLSRLALTTPAERETLLRRAARRAAFDPAGGIPQRVAAQAALRPEAPAVGWPGPAGTAWMSYGELETAASRLARRLRAAGVGPEQVVGLCLERGPQAVVGILGILQAGGAYLALDPAYPAERLEYLVADSGIAVIVTEAATAERLPPCGARLLSLDAEEAEEEAPDLPLPEPLPDNLAYVIYTSGSTGRPKGVGVTHRNVLRLFEAAASRFDFGPDAVWSLFHSLAFDFSVWELWGALFHGGRVVVVPEATRRSPEDFHALLAEAGVTVLSQTPSAFRQLDRVDAARHGEGPPLALREVIFGGEALEPAALRGWFERHGEARPRLVNMYGITETTVHVTWREIGRADAEAGHGSPIGEPLDDLSLHLLDAALQPVPDGLPGQLHVGGDGLARGYLGRPDLTAERFLPDPFSDRAGARLYATGDLARRRADGEIEYLGRLDQQVKLRGHRIELGEIAAALLDQPEIAEAVVLLQGADEAEQRLVAWAVPAAGAEPEAAGLLARLRARLPAYMVPAALVFLEALPLTAHGKLDRAALPAPGRADAAAAAFLAPDRGLEAEIAELWRDLLGAEAVGAEDNFFDLGGHSLLMPRLQQSLAERLGREIGIVELFRFPTVRSLAAHLAGAAEQPADPAEGERRRAGRGRLQRRRTGGEP